MSEWSNIAGFRLVFDDRTDHGGGDSKKVCGAGAPPFHGHGGFAGLAALLTIVALGLRFFSASSREHVTIKLSRLRK
ncbi:MAG: hypothetical protein HY716_06120 [Planctomycetes bacterium]|nr:hypothetical protein [Planctomycetota bacterium]